MDRVIRVKAPSASYTSIGRKVRSHFSRGAIGTIVNTFPPLYVLPKLINKSSYNLAYNGPILKEMQI